MKIILAKYIYFYLARKAVWNNFCQHQFCAQMVPLKLRLKQQQMQNEEQIQTEWAQKHFATLRILNICKFGAKYWNIKLHLSNINNQCETVFQTFIQNMSSLVLVITSIQFECWKIRSWEVFHDCLQSFFSSFHKLNYLRKSIFTSFPTYKKFWIFLLTAAKHELYADFHN